MRHYSLTINNKAGTRRLTLSAFNNLCGYDFKDENTIYIRRKIMKIMMEIVTRDKKKFKRSLEFCKSEFLFCGVFCNF